MKPFKEYYRDLFSRDKHEHGILGNLTKLKDENLLSEGLITSYPYSSVITMLHREFPKLTHIQAELFGGVKTTSGISIFFKNEDIDDATLNDIKTKLIPYGYFVAFTSPDSSDETGIFIEPKFSFIIDPKLLKNKRCFHITHKKYLPKIQKIGLIPKKTETDFNHDGNRIYLLFGDSKSYTQLFANTLARSKNWNTKDIVILEISNFDKLELYYDINFKNDGKNIAGFTFNNIFKDNIEVIQIRE